MNKLVPARLQEILAPWPARSGLYVVSGTVELIPLLEDVLAQFFDAEKKAETASLVGPAYWIDSGNYFNAYQMAELAKRRSIDPKMVLRTLRIARPFTAYQFQQMLDKIPQPVLVEKNGRKEWRTPLVVISDLMALFYDPEIQEEDLKRAFREFLTKLMKLKRRAILLTVLIDRHVPENRKFILPRILEMADQIHGSLPSSKISPTLLRQTET